MKTSLFTVSFAGFWGQHKLTLEQSIDQAAELEFAGVEIMGKRPHLSPLDYTPEDCDRIRRLVEQRNLKVSAVAAYTNFTAGMDAAEIPLLEMQVSYVEQLAMRTKRLGCDLVRIFSSYERSDVPISRQWQLTADAIRQCCDRAERHGVSIGLQNHHDIGADSRALAALIDEVDRPNLVPMYDCWSPFLRGEDVALGAAMFARQMRLTTVADYVRIPHAKYRADLVNYETAGLIPLVQAVPMGQGELPYDLFFRALRQNGFDGWVSYETCSPLRGGGSLENLRRYARSFLQYLHEWDRASLFARDG